MTMGVMTADLTLWERNRRAVRTEIADAAMGLFLAQGFAATSAEEIARAAGISRRSFSRYFTGKDDVLNEALASLGKGGGRCSGRSTGRRAALGCAPAGIRPLIEQADIDPNAAALAWLMLERPELQHGKDAAWHANLVEVLQARLSGEDLTVLAPAMAASAIPCLHVAQEQWISTEESGSLSQMGVHPLSQIAWCCAPAHRVRHQAHRRSMQIRQEHHLEGQLRFLPSEAASSSVLHSAGQRERGCVGVRSLS
jgi:AcrR family transcriptional regulator